MRKFENAQIKDSALAEGNGDYGNDGKYVPSFSFKLGVPKGEKKCESS